MICLKYICKHPLMTLFWIHWRLKNTLPKMPINQLHNTPIRFIWDYSIVHGKHFQRFISCLWKSFLKWILDMMSKRKPLFSNFKLNQDVLLTTAVLMFDSLCHLSTLGRSFDSELLLFSQFSLANRFLNATHLSLLLTNAYTTLQKGKKISLVVYLVS